MTSGQWLDLLLAIGISSAAFSVVYVKGDALFIGMWMYIVIPLAAMGLATCFHPQCFFQSGTSFGLTVAMLAWSWTNWSITNTAGPADGLAGLPYMLSLPAATFGLCIAADRLRNRGQAPAMIAFMYGFLGTLGGFTASFAVFALIYFV
jgi:hypothetical protein